MNNAKLYPKITAQVFNSPNNKDEYFLFNTATNRGFAVDGYAAILCKKFNGEKTLEEIVKNFESEQKLESGEFSEEISTLLSDLEKNRLITFHNEAQLP